MTTLQEHLTDWCGSYADRKAVVATVTAIAAAASEMATVIAQGPLAGDVGRVLGPSGDGDGQ